MKKITAKKYAQSLYEATEGLPRAEVKIALENFLKILVKNKNFKLADKITEELDKYIKEQEGVVEAEVVTAQGLTSAVKKELEEKIKQIKKASKVEIIEKEDKEILGGVIIKIGDTILDGSLKTRLELLKKETMK